jgi:hypothetical protein
MQSFISVDPKQHIFIKQFTSMTTQSDHDPTDRTSPLEAGIDVELGVANAGGAENLERLRSKLSIQDQTSRLPMKQLLIVFFGLAISLLLSFLDMTSVSTAWPSMAREFESASEVSWVGTSFLIANTSMQILYSRLSNVVGRKVVFRSAIALFAVGNLLCGFIQSMVECSEELTKTRHNSLFFAGYQAPAEAVL